MKMYYYRGPRPNFGDELNRWIWPRLLPNFFDEDETTLFIGIGSTLYDFLPRTSNKIVFGAGYGGYTDLPTIDHRWTFYFVRGRITAKALGLDESMAVGDAAILVRSCGLAAPPKKYKASFIPHWESAGYGEWADVTRAAGLHYIDPSGDVEHVMADILKSELVIAEAMHGAIVSDALRVPWVPVRPIQMPHRLKWSDWASALDVQLRFGRLPPSNALEYVVSLTRSNRRLAQRLRRRAQWTRRIASAAFQDRAASSLVRLSRSPAHLSSDSAIDRAHTRMLEHLQRLRSQTHRAVAQS